MNELEKFNLDCEEEINKQGADSKLKELTMDWFNMANQHKYSYHFQWLSRPIIQYPQDIVAVQEIIWKVKPDLIIETGIAHGGSLIFSASMLALIDYTEYLERNHDASDIKQNRLVLGIDIDIRKHNKIEIEKHPLNKYIKMLEGSSTSSKIIEEVKNISKNYKNILVILDSNHTHEHVLDELRAFAPLVSINSYCIVFDTVIEDMKNQEFPNRPWSLGNNPKTAVWDFLKENNNFEINHNIDNKLLISVAPHGYLKRKS
jgi:cephalosporin hydroxylase